MSAYFFGWDYTINKQEKTAWQLVNRTADFLLNESIRIDSHNESNRIDSNRELECSSLYQLKQAQHGALRYDTIRDAIF